MLPALITPLVRSLTKNGIKITDAAVSSLRNILKPSEFLRVNVMTSGCAGLTYKFAVDTDRRKDDDVTKREALSCVLTIRL